MILTPALATYVSMLLSVLGIADSGIQQIVKAAIAGALGLIVAVWQWQHHATLRNRDNQAAAVRLAQITAPAPHHPMPHEPAPVQQPGGGTVSS